METLTVKTSLSSYDIAIGAGVFQALPDLLRGKKSMVITDDNVDRIYGSQLRELVQGEVCKVLVLPSGEKTKCLTVLGEIYEALANHNMTRTDPIVAFGGGVIGDIAGFAAATYLRGVPYIQVPTTLLAQVDSSVGGKVAIDLPQGKNLVGNFYPPRRVLIDPNFLTTLPQRVFCDGMAEVIKYGCIRDRALFDLLAGNITDRMEQVISTCVKIKRDIVQRDEFDTGERMLLNFGHTFGHVVEKLYHYETYTHGEGVAMGMLQITRKTEAMGMTKPGTCDILKKMLEKYKLLFEDFSLDFDTAKQALLLDKKSAGDTIRYVVLKEIGDAVVTEFPKDNLFLLEQ